MHDRELVEIKPCDGQFAFPMVCAPFGVGFNSCDAFQGRRCAYHPAILCDCFAVKEPRIVPSADPEGIIDGSRGSKTHGMPIKQTPTGNRS